MQGERVRVQENAENGVKQGGTCCHGKPAQEMPPIWRNNGLCCNNTVYK